MKFFLYKLPERTKVEVTRENFLTPYRVFEKQLSLGMESEKLWESQKNYALV
jgi:hypothetical protein